MGHLQRAVEDAQLAQLGVAHRLALVRVEIDQHLHLVEGGVRVDEGEGVRVRVKWSGGQARLRVRVRVRVRSAASPWRALSSPPRR